MAPSKIRKAIGTLKDHTSISLARVRGSTAISHLKVAIVKATCHDDKPPNQRYVSDVLNLTSFSRTLVTACISIIAIRLNKTKNWVVALKTLMLVQRLLSQEGQAFEKEIFFTRRKGTKFLNMCDFRDASSKTNAWDYSAFVRTYALYLDEQVEFRMQGYRGKRAGCMLHGEEEREEREGRGSADVAVKATPVLEMKTPAVFSRVHLLMQLLDRFLACKPTGASKHNMVVAMALYPIVQESFQLLYNITEILGILIDRFMRLDIPDMVKVYEIFCHISKQFDELDAFYDWCKTFGIMRFSKFPDVKQIPQSKLDTMDEFIRQKAAILQKKMRVSTTEPKPTPVEQVKEEEPEKALPQPERSTEEKKDEVKEEQEEELKIQEEGDLLNLYEDAPSTEEEGDKLALALFGCYPSTTAPETTTPPWEAFKDSSKDWETALVESVSHLSNQKPSLPEGFDTFALESMYQQAPMGQVMALPGPPAADGFSANVDPFAASLAVAPPPYVQMSETERKYRLLVEEQLMWQQFQNPYQYIP